MKPRQWEVKDMGSAQGVYEPTNAEHMAAWIQRQPPNRCRKALKAWVLRIAYDRLRSSEATDRFSNELNELLGEEER